ncbi:Vacuolar fusion protein mon1 [Endocarpon pusillum Z07020]|uniref:Vacuolar fusion protein MON1 n=1 Tax=Endocarpon pusillum (strain Z07020 / HMAS-L-300199) TaxID=1263415 RepID=U1GI60_ENDPU|nr:Vacuolar fusion protein mon1 [Endocarpon pusillum Z07020]ERF71803.1 Vacuolar fusion protein mon1 [Endocarpon pusillum Z07020]
MPRISNEGDDHNTQAHSSPSTPKSPKTTIERSKLEVPRPPLPPRPTNLSTLRSRPSTSYQEHGSKDGLLSGTTTAVTTTDVNTYTTNDGSRKLHTSIGARSPSSSTLKRGVIGSPRVSDTGDSSSLRSYVPQLETREEVSSLFGNDITDDDDEGNSRPFQDVFSSQFEADAVDIDFDKEFDKIPEVDEDGNNEELAHSLWKSKSKHFMILSAAGKPIYTRHGSDAVISGYIGIVQTIISFYQSSGNSLRSFSSAGARFVILSQANLFLVAISRILESDTQLRLQLEALYMQILSTLTLPNLTHIFSVRPSSDLRRPLQGTEVLLSSLADSFTRGSPSTLLSALESLKLRKSHRDIINNTLLKSRVDDLLYGLIVAGGRLVSVVRPKKHSLHPGDLQLIFNMLFEAEGVKTGGGESWIPLCLPGFNPKGYLYMFVSFLSLTNNNIRQAAAEEEIPKEDAVAIILISANKESFESMRSVKNYLVHELGRSRSLGTIQNAIQAGRPVPTDIVPGTVLRHFLFKSKANVQFFMPSFTCYETPRLRRRLLSVYHELHASVHTKHASVKVHHSVSASHAALAWVTPMFELYCVAGPGTGRNALAHSANKVVQWVQEEEERVFLIGGAVF